jgi:hypothetical protein
MRRWDTGACCDMTFELWPDGCGLRASGSGFLVGKDHALGLWRGFRSPASFLRHHTNIYIKISNSILDGLKAVFCRLAGVKTHPETGFPRISGSSPADISCKG